MEPNASKWSDNRFWQKIKPTLGQIIIGTKCDSLQTDFFYAERWSIRSN